MRRETKDISEYTADILRDLDEVKTSQPFGGDAIVCSSFTQLLVSGDDMAEYRLLLTPTNPKLGVLPMMPELIWQTDDPYALRYWMVTQEWRDDGVFEWYIYGFEGEVPVSINLQWLGGATAELVRIA